MIKSNNLINNKIIFFRNILEEIQISSYKYMLLNILSNSDYNICLESIEKIVNLINTINEDNLILELEYIQNSISSLIKNYGVYSFNSFLKILLNKDFIEKNVKNNLLLKKFEVIEKYLHPINYKVINWNNKLYNKNDETNKVIKNKLIDDKILVEESNMFECFDLMRITNNFNIRIYGIKLIIHDKENKRTLNINCIIDNLIIDNIQLSFIKDKIKGLNNYIIDIEKIDNYDIINYWSNYLELLNIKDLLIYSNEEIFNKFNFLLNNFNKLENKSINVLVNDFIQSDLFEQRQMIINLLLNNNKSEYQYISYLLYDILSGEIINNTDSFEQKQLLNSLPIKYKKLFKDAMYKTIEYTTNLSDFDNNKIPLEQQICLLKTNNNVKEKAMQKLKEIKSKSEDSGSKARQYLDGLLKIPFSIFKTEDILLKKNDIVNLYNDIKNIHKNSYNILKSITITDINNFVDLLNEKILNNFELNTIHIIDLTKTVDSNINNVLNILCINIIDNLSKKKYIISYLKNLEIVLDKSNINIFADLKKNSLEKKTTIQLKNDIKIIIDNNKNNRIVLLEFIKEFTNNNDLIYNYFLNIEKNFSLIIKNNKDVVNYINNINTILDNSVHGHKNAKNQIERIIGQWINGEMTGYCFGFEGPPGVGKTTLAKKGLANCLKDKNNESRPFSFIALGGSSNGSTIEGHNYTYVGSTWGKIVDILIEKQCMNPIIFIDELDKVSKTEHGKEIIGILTHLTDTTQNESFQDKYFSNIELDLSKVLFIFSYNDVEQVDKILLDRIHRIKFDNLNLDEKITICEKFLLPEFYKKFGLENVIDFDCELIKYIIENYTNEPGVRKLKEILFEIVSTINLKLLRNIELHNIPLIVTKELIQTILKDKLKIRYVKINLTSEIGLINGMWANSYGNSGILHIETKYFCTNNCLELKLTGMQGDVMKESMNVAKTLAWNLLNENQKKNCIKNFTDTKNQGIHIHIPEGATPKDGPSAGAAITLAIYSLFTNRKIRNNYAITGEICLSGKVTAIGSLDLKILGGIRADVKNFLYPKENNLDFKNFYDKHKDKLLEYEFHEVSSIQDVIKYMLI